MLRTQKENSLQAFIKNKEFYTHINVILKINTISIEYVLLAVSL